MKITDFEKHSKAYYEFQYYFVRIDELGYAHFRNQKDLDAFRLASIIKAMPIEVNYDAKSGASKGHSLADRVKHFEKGKNAIL